MPNDTPQPSDLAAQAAAHTSGKFIASCALTPKLGSVDLVIDLGHIRLEREAGYAETVQFNLPDWETGVETERASFHVSIAQLDGVVAAFSACVNEARRRGMLPEATA